MLLLKIKLSFLDLFGSHLVFNTIHCIYHVLNALVSGTEFGYHAITFALYLDAIIRRADPQKRSLAEYFNDEFAKPLGELDKLLDTTDVHLNVIFSSE